MSDVFKYIWYIGVMVMDIFAVCRELYVGIWQGFRRSTNSR